MSAGRKLSRRAGAVVLCLGALCLGVAPTANADAAQSQHKTKTKKVQKPQLPPLPSGPTGPVQPMPLDSMAPVPPQVSYHDSQLTIVAPNSTLGDILRAVRKQTGAEIEIPPATERVVTHLGPGPAREVISQLLNGSRFNYVLLGSPADDYTDDAADQAAAEAEQQQQQPSSPDQPAVKTPQQMLQEMQQRQLQLQQQQQGQPPVPPPQPPQ